MKKDQLPLELARRYIELHNFTRSAGNVNELTALFDSHAAIMFNGDMRFLGSHEFGMAFFEQPPTDDLVELDATATAAGARMTYAWRTAPATPAGTLEFEIAGGRIRKLSITTR